MAGPAIVPYCPSVLTSDRAHENFTVTMGHRLLLLVLAGWPKVVVLVQTFGNITESFLCPRPNIW